MWADSARAIVLVAAVAVGAAALISASHEISSERIERNETERTIRSLQEVLGPSLYDNDLVASQVWATDPDLLGTVDPVRVYLATRDGAPAAAIFAAVAPHGYNGAINLLVGIDSEGVVQGVRVTSHRETPGLGDRIDLPVSDWITGFDGASLAAPPLPQWAVVADGGRFDAFTGATVTPRAVVRAVRDALIYFNEHKEELFAQAAAGAAPDPTAETIPDPTAETIPDPTAEPAPNPAAEPAPNPAAEPAPNPAAEPAPNTAR